MPLAEPIQITQRIAREFERLEIRYLVGGSLASSLHGIPRATNDVDMVADITYEHIPVLVNALKSEFYIDVLGVLQVQGEQLDYSYLERAAHQRGVSDLLTQALTNAKRGGMLE